jgi:hypothetical protein
VVVLAFLGTGGPPILLVAIGTGLGGIGWLAGLWLTSHPLFLEIRNAAEVAAKYVTGGPRGVGRPIGGSR